MEQRVVILDAVPEIVLLCSFCGKRRNDAGEWEPEDGYVEKLPYAFRSHGICPTCAKIQFPDEYAAISMDRKREELENSLFLAGGI
jgi:hypothetical protein